MLKSFYYQLLAPNVFRPIVEIQQDCSVRSENASLFNNRVQRRKVSDSSAESNTNKLIGSPDDLQSNRTENGLNASRSTLSMGSSSGGPTPIGPPKLSHRPQPSSSQEVNSYYTRLTAQNLKIFTSNERTNN